MSNAGHVSGKVAVVTGGAHGMGAAHVRALAREGAIVAATDIIDDLGASLAEQLQSEGRDVSYYHHDVTSRAGWEAVVASVSRRTARSTCSSTTPACRSVRWESKPTIANGTCGNEAGDTNPCLGSGRKAAGAMLEYARYSRSSTRFSSMSESRSLLRISRSRPPDRVSSTAIRRELHAPATHMVRDESYSLGNGDGQRPNPGISGCSQ
jgi:NAD(P)-dependent dehydrogenase (short-subunit alcohol dehydrogenase family)